MVKNVIKGSFPIGKGYFPIYILIATYVGKMKILDYFMIANVKNVIKGSFPISKVLVFGGNSYVCEKMKILDYFMIANGKECD